MNSHPLFLFLYYYEERKTPRTSNSTVTNAPASNADLASGSTCVSDVVQNTLLAVIFIPIALLSSQI